MSPTELPGRAGGSIYYWANSMKAERRGGLIRIISDLESIT